jgi:hypothetical protein
MLPWHVGSFEALGPVPIGRKFAYFYFALLSNQLSLKDDRKREVIIKICMNLHLLSTWPQLQRYNVENK